MLGPGVAFTGRVVVRLESAITAAVRAKVVTTPSLAPQGLGSVLSAIQSTPGMLDVASLLSHLGQHSALLATSTVPASYVANVNDWEDDAEQSNFPPLHSLFSYWIVDLRGRSVSVNLSAIVAAIANHFQIDTAYRERNLREPAPWVVTDDNETNQQQYLFGATAQMGGKFGINAHNSAVWGKYSGAGIGFVDVERGWRTTHQDFPQPANLLIGANVASAQEHGTQSVGVAVGIDHPASNPLGIVGVAPGAKLLGVASRVSAVDATKEWELTEAIVAARNVLGPGDVLLLEAETAGGSEGGYPVEVDAHHFDAIRLASAAGIVVIEPAGNGWSDKFGGHAHNLDLPIPAGYWAAPSPVLNRNLGFDDSGAVMVSSCESVTGPGVGHRRMVAGSYGSRIDCYAWGANVRAPYTLGTQPDSEYSTQFGGTSSAAAIIAGAALLVQEMAARSVAPGNRLSPTQLRALFRREDLGTPIYDVAAVPGASAVGWMPDLALIANEFDGLPDVFIRDAIGDDGSVPSLNLAQSPDIIVKSAWSGGDPDVAFGEASPFAEQTPPNDDVRLNRTNYLFVRMRNRGLAQATDVVATVYWAEAGAYIPPSDWHLIGSAAPVVVAPAGSIVGVPYGPLKVAGPINWAPTALPVQHACFIAVLDHELDPAPPTIANLLANTVVTWDTFFAFIQGQNNAAWRNFNVLTLGQWIQGLLTAKAAFNINGPQDETAPFDIEIERRGSPDHQWKVVVPKAFARRLTPELARRIDEYDRDSGDDAYSLPIERSGARFSEVRLRPGERQRCQVEVVVPAAGRPEPGALAITQRYRGRVVGRVSFVLTEHSWRPVKRS